MNTETHSNSPTLLTEFEVPRAIAITNSSFETDDLDDGKWTAGAFGWITNKSEYAGAWDPNASDFSESPHGQNVAWIEGEGTYLRQTLSETYDNEASYNFSFSVGDSIHYGTQSFTINLYAGGVLIGTASGSTSGDGFITAMLQVDQTDRVDLNGQNLTLEIVNNSSGELFIDNVQAEVSGGTPSNREMLAVNVAENTSIVVDLNDGGGVPDIGVSICLKDKKLPEDNKPIELVLTYAFGTTINQVDQQKSDKAFIATSGSDADGTVYIRILDKDFKQVLFEGTVSEGQSFAVSNGGSKFASETNFEVYDHAGGVLIQSGQFHTSTTQPLAIGDTFGSLTLNGATLGGGTSYGIPANDGALGDIGVIYQITGGADASLFDVDHHTGEVRFLTPPDYENPQGAHGGNVYDVQVSAYDAATQSVVVNTTPLQIKVADDPTDAPIEVAENTTMVVDLNLSVECFVTAQGADLGQDLGSLKDKDLEEDNKPVELTLTYSFGTTIEQVETQKSDKAFLSTSGSDSDGNVYLRVLDKHSDVLFEGTISDGESFTVANGGKKFDSETNFEVYDSQGGSLIQSGQFHTSGSQPLAIGDTFGSLTLDGAKLGGGQVLVATTTALKTLSEASIEYSIAGGADAGLFHIDAVTGQVSFISPQDFEAPQDADGDNLYDVVIRATAKTDAACFNDQSIQVRINDIVNEPTGEVIMGRIFAETSFVEGFGDTDYGVGDATVVLSKDGLRVSEVRTNRDGTYHFDGLDDGDYMVKVLPLSGGDLLASSANVSVVDGALPVINFEVLFHDYATQLNAFDAASFVADFDTLLRYGGDAEATGIVSYSLHGDDAALFTIDAQTGRTSFRPEVLTAGSAPADANGDGIYDFTVLRDGGAFLSVPREEVELELLATTETESGIISGRYFDDARGTGLKVGGNGDAPGVKNALVVLFDDKDNLVRDSHGNLISAVTDKNGAYVLEGVPQGSFKVGFEANSEKPFARGGRDKDGNGRADVREASDIDATALVQSVSILNGSGQGSRAVDFATTGLFSVSAGEVVADVDASVISGALYGTDASDVLTGGDATDRMFGFAGDDVLNGGGGDDVLDGGVGFDILTGGAGQDAFIFREGEGTTIITDFQIGYDFLDIEGFSGIEDDEALRSMASQNGSDTVFDLGGWTLILENIELAALGPGDLCAY